ncbi:hypothetical protein EDB85DRAFT_2274195 [Lactarius pseudohatsudake]|nr:hypothetical protein EDB85DRAFT_2274195 [Lactarius pseudohatsudake]
MCVGWGDSLFANTHTVQYNSGDWVDTGQGTGVRRTVVVSSSRNLEPVRLSRGNVFGIPGGCPYPVVVCKWASVKEPLTYARKCDTMTPVAGQYLTPRAHRDVASRRTGLEAAQRSSGFFIDWKWRAYAVYKDLRPLLSSPKIHPAGLCAKSFIRVPQAAQRYTVSRVVVSRPTSSPLATCGHAELSCSVGNLSNSSQPPAMRAFSARSPTTHVDGGAMSSAIYPSTGTDGHPQHAYQTRRTDSLEEGLWDVIGLSVKITYFQRCPDARGAITESTLLAPVSTSAIQTRPCQFYY